jgi:hypothetical protein
VIISPFVGIIELTAGDKLLYFYFRKMNLVGYETMRTIGQIIGCPTHYLAVPWSWAGEPY